MSHEQLFGMCEEARQRYVQAAQTMAGQENSFKADLGITLADTNAEVMTLLDDIVRLTGDVEQGIAWQQAAIGRMQEELTSAAEHVKPIQKSDKKNAQTLVQSIGSVARKVTELESDVDTCRQKLDPAGLDVMADASLEIAQNQNGMHMAVRLGEEAAEAFSAAGFRVDSYVIIAVRKMNQS